MTVATTSSQQHAKLMPRYWAELQAERPGIGISGAPKFVEDLVLHNFKALGHPEVDTNQKLQSIFAQELSKVLRSANEDDLPQHQETLFGFITSLVNTAGKVDKAVRQESFGAAPAASSSVVIPQQITIDVSTFAFGARDWNKYFGDVGVEPPLPADIAEILKSPCPIYPGKRIEETHTLVLVPATINGKPLTLDSLGELIQQPQNEGKASKYSFYWHDAKKQIGQTPAPAAHWVLMTTDILPNSRSKSYEAQVAEVKKYSGYEIPRALEAAVAILMGYIKSGVCWYGKNPRTYTRCQEKVVGCQISLGSFGSSGLDVDSYRIGFPEEFGIGALRQFRS